MIEPFVTPRQSCHYFTIVDILPAQSLLWLQALQLCRGEGCSFPLAAHRAPSATLRANPQGRDLHVSSKSTALSIVSGVHSFFSSKALPLNCKRQSRVIAIDYVVCGLLWYDQKFKRSFLFVCFGVLVLFFCWWGLFSIFLPLFYLACCQTLM